MNPPYSLPGEAAAPRVREALVPVVALIVLIRESLMRYGGSAHVPLILATAVAALMALRRQRWEVLERGLIDGITVGLKATLILLVVGMLIGTWIAGGIVPVLIYHGLKLLNPSIFLGAACLICCVVSVATGSSWTTAGTVGIALMGVGQGLGVPLPMAAGAIVSGAYFGDKISPLSDTTNLAPAVAGSELFEHVRYMMLTTLPSLGGALLLYGVLGWSGHHSGANAGQVDALRAALDKTFNLSPVLLLPPVLVIAMVLLRLPALPALLAGALLGAGLAAWVQGAPVKEILAAAQSGYVAKTGVEAVDKLLSRGGLDGMLPTVSLILCALAFGGVMERAGFLAALASFLRRFARGTWQLVATTAVTCVGMNALTADQYLSIIMPGRMYRDVYRQHGLHPKLLSRTLEDAGTLTSPLIPWSTCGAFMATTLGVATSAYLPYTFLNLLNPLMAVAIAAMGWKIARVEEGSPKVKG
jgi:NhaC family Na+:H+ antiporter